MRTGWTRDDVITFWLAGSLVLCGVGLLLIADGWQLAVALLVIIEAALLTTHRLHLRANHNAAWISGRTAMISSLAEASRRDLAFTDWLIGEAERDGFGPEVRAALRRRGE